MAGGDASQVPAALDPSWINRKFEAIEQWQREMMPSVARTVTELVASQVRTITVDDTWHTFGLYSSGAGAVFEYDITAPNDAFDTLLIVLTVEASATITTAGGTYISGVVDVAGQSFPFSSAVMSGSGNALASRSIVCVATGIGAGDTVTLRTDVGVVGTAPADVVTSSAAGVTGAAMYYRS